MMTLKSVNSGFSPAVLFAAKAQKNAKSSKTTQSKTPEQMAATLQSTLRKVYPDVTVRFNPPYPPELPIAPDYPKGFFLVSLSQKTKAVGLDRVPKVIQALQKIGVQALQDDRYNPPVVYRFNDIPVVFSQRAQLL